MEVRTRRPRIADVAREAGVSKTAVSFAFNAPDRLSPGTASRILEVADALGYRPDPVARMLSQRRTGALGILTPQTLSAAFSNPFFGQFAEGAALAIEESGYTLDFISPVHGSLARAIDRATVDGIVAVGLSAHHPDIESLERSGLPIVLVDSGSPADHPSVDVDDVGGARLAAQHLLSLGHRDILVLAVEPPDSVGGHEADSVPERRLRGYRDAIAEGGGDLPPESIVESAASIDGGRAALLRAWHDGRRPTAILAMSDVTAFGAISAVRELGQAVPRDLSIVGFDDLDLAEHTDPPLTTVHQPVREKGAEAARLLVAAVDGSATGAPAHLHLATRLVVRGSTAPPRRRPRSDRRH